MNKQLTLSLILLCSLPAYTRANNEPTTLESKTLNYIDGTPLFDGKTVSMLHRYKEQLHHFMHAPYTIDGEEYSLLQLARREQDGLLPENAFGKDTRFALLVEEFAAFSEKFVDTIRPVKPVLSELIREFCIKRNRPDSTLLLLVEGANGEELTLFKKEITSYNKLCGFCIDLIHFFKDLLNSCPKAVNEYKHYNAICRQVTMLLNERKISLKKESFRALIADIHKQYEAHEEITQAKTAALLKAYMTKYTA